MNTELSAKKILQQYHSAFYKLFHVPLDWIDQRNRTFTLCSNEHCHPLCRKIMEHRHGRESCEKLTSERIQRCRSSRTFQISRCHAGLVDAIVPLFVGNRYIGSLCVGQFLREKLSEDDLRSLRRRLCRKSDCMTVLVGGTMIILKNLNTLRPHPCRSMTWKKKA